MASIGMVVMMIAAPPPYALATMMAASEMAVAWPGAEEAMAMTVLCRSPIAFGLSSWSPGSDAGTASPVATGQALTASGSGFWLMTNSSGQPIRQQKVLAGDVVATRTAR